LASPGFMFEGWRQPGQESNGQSLGFWRP